MIENSSSMDRPAITQRSPRVTILIAGAAAVVLIALAALLPSILRWARSDRSVDATTVRFATVTRGDLLRDVSVQGRVVASRSPTLFSSGQGIVVLATRAGAVVQEGEVLATVDSKEVQASFDQAQAQLLSMRAELDRQRILARQQTLRGGQHVQLLELRLGAAQRQLERIRRLFEMGLSNKADFETAQDEVRIATMELEQARGELALSGETAGFEVATRQQHVRRQESVLAELRKRVEGLTIRAPFDGIVAAVPVDDRDAVAANQPIVQVVNLSSLEVEIGLPEQYATETAIGTQALISFQGRDYRGHVTGISPEVVNSQVVARVAFEGEPPAGLKQNQRLTTRLTFEARRNVLKVPRGAFVESGGGRTAWVVEKGKIARRRSIETGAASVTEVEIVRGLEEGQSIVVSDTAPFGDATTVMLR